MSSPQLKNPGALGRLAVLQTPNGDIETPAFTVVGTKATVKALTPSQLQEIGIQALLCNTYHLYLQPGDKIVKDAGGLKKFSGWNGPTVTDSGGFQAFSLGKAFGKGISKIAKGISVDEKKNGEEEITPMAKVEEDGVRFKSHIDGSEHFFTPEKSIEIQHNIGADIIFVFDEPTSPHDPIEYQNEALERTHRWAKRCLDYHNSKENSLTQGLFGIVQGGQFKELREKSAQILASMDFSGYGIGGSYTKEDISKVVALVNSILPREKPRHLLGIGEVGDIFEGVEHGCDTFDCVSPTRQARNGSVYTANGPINILNSSYKTDFSPIDEGCGCYACRNFTRSYLAHLFRAKEILGSVLATIHNVYFINQLFEKIRRSIKEDNFFEFKEEYLKKYYSN